MLLFPVVLLASNPDEAKTFKRVELSYSFSPMVTYRILKENYFGPDSMDAVIQQEILDRRNQKEKIEFGFSTGLRVKVNVVKFFAVESGIEYYLHRYIYKGDLVYLTGFNGSVIDTLGTYKANYLYNYHYLKIPVAATFTVGKEKFKAIFSLGTGMDVFLRMTQTTTSVFNGTKNVRTDAGKEPFVKFNLTPFAAIGFEYEINDKMKIRAMPFAQIQALKNTDSPITEHLWCAGINLSFSYGWVDVKK